jgi:hypothetical protein
MQNNENFKSNYIIYLQKLMTETNFLFTNEETK